MSEGLNVPKLETRVIGQHTVQVPIITDRHYALARSVRDKTHLAITRATETFHPLLAHTGAEYHRPTPYRKGLAVVPRSTHTSNYATNP